MDTRTLANSDVTAAARLLIHAAGDDASNGLSVGSIIQRVRAHVLDGPRRERALPALEIQDLQGYRVLALDDACPLVDVALPPGTYHVTTDHAGTRRSYTVALEQGASVVLYLRLARDRR